MANANYRFKEFRDKNNPNQLQTQQWEVDSEGNRISAIVTLPGGADQYKDLGTVINCPGGSAVEYTYSVIENETTYPAYVEFRPKGNCSGSALYSTGFGMPANSSTRVQPENILKTGYCLFFSTPGHRSRLVNEANQLIASTDGITAGQLDNHTPLTRYKVLIGIDIVSFKVTNLLPVAADIFLRDGSTGTTLFQTPAGGILPNGSFTFAGIDAVSYTLELVASGMVNRPKRAQVVNANNVVYASTAGDGVGRFPTFIPQGSPFGDIRLVEEGAVTVNDLQVASSTTSRYVGNQQQVVIFLTSASLASIGPFQFRIQDPYTDAILARVDSATYTTSEGYVLTMPSPLSGQVRVRARALRGTISDTTDDWEAIDRIITLYPNESTFVRKIGVKYEGLDAQNRQTVLLLVNSSYADTKFKWDGFTNGFQSMISTVDYAGYTHYVRLFGETTRATFDSVQTLNIQPKTAAQDILTVTYVRGNDTPGTIKVLFGGGDTATDTPTILSIDARFVTVTSDNTGGGGSNNPGNDMLDIVYGTNLNIGYQSDPSILNVSLKSVSNGRFQLQAAFPQAQNGYHWADIINEDDNQQQFYTGFDGLSWPVGFPVDIKRYLIPNGMIGRDARQAAIRYAESSINVY